MSGDPYDYYDDYEPDYREAFYQEFSRESLASYFLDNPLLHRPAIGALTRARRYVLSDPSVAYAFAAASMEYCFKQVILRPLVYGFVHDPNVAALIASEVVKPTGVDRFESLLKDSLGSATRIDLNTFTRPGATVPLWQEMTSTWRRRNEVVHRCEQATGTEASAAVAVATTLLDSIFPEVLDSLGLRLDASDTVVRK